MALPLLSTLGKALRAALPLFEGGVAEGLSANTILGIARSAGMGVNRQAGLTLIRALQGIALKSQALSGLKLNAFVNTARLDRAVTVIRRQFSFKVRVRGFSFLVQRNVERFVTITTDVTMTRADLEARAVQMVVDKFSVSEIDVENALLFEGVRAGDAGVL